MYSVQQLNLWINEQHILKNIAFDFPAHSITAIVGPSGSGKSSFLLTLHDLHPEPLKIQTTGSLNILSDINSKPKKLPHEWIGSVFQSPNPFPMSIWKNMELPLKERKIPKLARKAFIEKALQDVGLYDEVAHRLHMNALLLSGGQQQRLCIARAIALKPKLLLMDEPCSALDPMASQVIESLILELKKDYTLIIVTHNLSQARRIADQVGFFWSHEGQGQLIEFAPSEALFQSPRHQLTQEFLEYEHFAGH